MPHFGIQTNLPRSKIPKDFVVKAVPIVARTLGKPEELCVVSVTPDLPMAFGGSTEPCGIANLLSIGKLGIEENKKHSSVLYELVEKELGIPSDRMYITFQDAVASNIGYKKSTFHGIPI